MRLKKKGAYQENIAVLVKRLNELKREDFTPFYKMATSTIECRKVRHYAICIYYLYLF